MDLEDRNGDEKGKDEYNFNDWPENSSQFLKGFQVRHPLERLLSSFRFIFERDSMISSTKEMKEYIYHTYQDETNQTQTRDSNE